MGISKTRRFLALFTSVMLLTLAACNNSAGSSDSDKDDEKPTPTTPSGGSGGGSAEIDKGPVTISFNIRANTGYCDIHRKKVDASGNDLPGEDWIIVGSLYPEFDKDNNKDRTKKFTDLYEVTKGSYYKYASYSELINKQDSKLWDEIDEVYQVTYDGRKAPAFGKDDKYPVIEFVPDTTGQEHHKLHLANADTVVFTFDNQEELTGWALNPVYNWKYYTWLEQSDLDYEFNDSNVATGDNLLTSFYVTLSINDGTNCDFLRRFYYDINDIDGDKIVKKVSLKSPEIIENNSEKKVLLKLQVPDDSIDVRDIYIQRRVASNNPWEKTTGYLDNRTTAYSVGYIEGSDIPGAVKNGLLTFYDRYGFEEDAVQYDYRAIIRIGDNYKEMEIPMGRTTEDAKLGGGPEITFKDDHLASLWDNQTLKIWGTQTDILVTNNSSVGIRPMLLMLSYVKTDDESKGFYPTFKYINSYSDVDPIPAPNNLGNDYTLKLVACNIVFQTSETGINSMVRIDPTTLKQGHIPKELYFSTKM